MFWEFVLSPLVKYRYIMNAPMFKQGILFSSPQDLLLLYEMCTELLCSASNHHCMLLSETVAYNVYSLAFVKCLTRPLPALLRMNH